MKDWQKDKFYSLEMHEKRDFNTQWTVFRVPWGWIYQEQFYCDENKTLAINSTFVPYSEEFLVNKAKEWII